VPKIPPQVAGGRARYVAELYRWPDGAQLAPPPAGCQWQAGVGPLYPVVVGFGDYESVALDIRLESFTAPCGDELHLRAKLEGAVLAYTVMELDPEMELPYEDTIWLSWAEPFPVNVVASFERQVLLEYSTDAGETWKPLAAPAPTRWYVMPARSAAELSEEERPRYDYGLNKVVQYARGYRDTDTIAWELATGIAAEIYYDPGGAGIVEGHILNAYDPPARALCMFNARLLRYLARASGVDASVVYLWGGGLNTRADFYQYAVPGNWVSFRAVAPPNEGAPANPHFSYHAETRIQGMWYDASYGRTGLATFSEMSPPYSESAGQAHYPPVAGETLRTPVQQQGSEWPPTASPSHIFVPYMCPH